MKKRFLSAFLALALIVSLCPMAFAASGQIKASLSSAQVKQGEKVSIQFKLDENPGFVSTNIQVNWPKDDLTLMAVSGTDTITGWMGEPIPSDGKTDGKYVLAWQNNTIQSNITTTGVLCTLEFATLSSGSVGEKEITLSNTGPGQQFTNFDMDTVDAVLTGGKITISSALSGNLPVTIAAPAKGGTPETTITGTNYTGSITWTPADTGGKFAADTSYTANVTLTANSGYQFADGVNPSVAGSDSVTGVNVKDSGSKLEFKATFPKTDTKTLNDIDIITNPELKLAVPTAAPNAAATNERSLAVTGVYDDGSGGPVAVNWEITTTPIPKGVSLDGSTLKVTNDAEDGQVRIQATSAEGYTDAEFVTITKDTAVESAIVLTAPSSTTVAVPKSDTPNKIDLPTAAVYDQYGKPMPGTSAITYKIVSGTSTGVTLAPGYGKIEVDRTAQAGEVKIVAKLGTTLTSDPVTYTITRETSQVTSVSVSKTHYFKDVPEVTELGTPRHGYHQFDAAKVLDQYGQEMTGQTVTWNVADDAGNSVTGVSIDNNGKLTVTNEAPAITVYVTATCLGIESNKTKMTLSKKPLKATFVEIYNQADGDPETSLLIPAATFTNSEAYTAKVYDQYGAETGEMVFWDLDKTYTGVELDTTTSSGNAILKVENTATPGTIKLIATCSTHGSTAKKTLPIALVDKTPASVTAVPAAKTDLFYNGTDQALVTAGTASGGTMQYSLDGTNWSIDVPTGKDVGAYTVQYKVVGDATHTDTTPQTCPMVIISPKFLTKDNLTPTGSTSKVYDGTTDSSITVGVKAGVFYGSDTITITGTAVYNSADVDEADTITFTPDAINTGNYRLAASQVLTITGASITRRDLTVTPNAGQSKKFGAADPTLLFNTNGEAGSETSAFTGKLGRAEGKAVGQYNITLGDLALKDNGTFKASNYTLKMASPAVKFEITKADAPALSDITLSQKYTVTTEQSKAIDTTGMPADAGTLTYTAGSSSVTTGTATVSSFTVDSTGMVKYTITGGADGAVINLPVTIGSDNYADATINVVITLTAKDDQAALTLTGGTTVAYGQTLQLGTSGGNGTGEATIDAATGKLTPVKVGTVKVTATKAADASFNEATSAEVEITITRATPTGAPKYTAITTSGKTLSDAALTTTGGTFSVLGTVKWVDDTGADLPATTTVEANKLYKWVFTPTDTANYKSINGSIKLWSKSTSSGGGYYAPTVPDMPMLYSGCTGDAVKTLQDKLNALGYNSGNVDGIFGAKTYAAVAAFQKANSLGVDGIVGKLTWGKLYGVSPAMPVETTTVVGRPMVSYGSRGDAVRKLQELLNALGYDCGSVDGIFGSKTKAAVLAFQKANGLGVDGIVGPLTWAKLG